MCRSGGDGEDRRDGRAEIDAEFERLESGDDYNRKIQRNIARCSFFIPVISATTQRRHEGYFRREWSYAVDRSRNIAEGAVFILPVCIDETPEAEALVQVGTALPMSNLTERIERELGKPVIGVNVATYWAALRSIGIGDRRAGFGKLYAEC